MCFSAVILVHHLKAVSLQIFYHQGYKFICQCGGKKVASSSFKNRLSIWGQDVGINTSHLTRRRIYSSILWVGALKVSTRLSQLMCTLVKVSLKSVVEDDFLDPLHLGVCLTSAFQGYSSTVFCVLPIPPLKYLITSRRVLTILFTSNNVIQYTITLVCGEYLTNIRHGKHCIFMNTTLHFTVVTHLTDSSRLSCL